MKYIKLFEQYSQSEYNEEYYYECSKVITDLIEGYPMTLNDLDVIYDYFGGEIPEEFKHSSYLYRYTFYKNKDEYNNALVNGVEPIDGYFLRCTGDTDYHDNIIENLGSGYEYYILFEVNVDKDKIIFGVNELAHHFDVSNNYANEEEVLVQNIKLEPEAILESGKIED